MFTGAVKKIPDIMTFSDVVAWQKNPKIDGTPFKTFEKFWYINIGTKIDNFLPFLFGNIFNFCCGFQKKFVNFQKYKKISQK